MSEQQQGDPQRSEELLWSFQSAKGKKDRSFLHPLGFDAHRRCWIAKLDRVTRSGNSIVLVNSDTGEVETEILQHSAQGASLSPDGQFFAHLSGESGALLIRRTLDSEIIMEWEHTSDGIGRIWFSQGLDRLYVEDGRGLLSIFDLRRERLIHQCNWQSQQKFLQWSPEGQLCMLSLQADGVELYDPDTMKLRGRIDVPVQARGSAHSPGIMSLAFTPDKSRVLMGLFQQGIAVVSSNGVFERILKWDFESDQRKEIFRRLADASTRRGLKTNPGRIESMFSDLYLSTTGLAVDPHQQYVASVSHDGFVRFWRLPELSLLATHDCLQGEPAFLAAGRSGDRIVAGQGPVFCWKAPFLSG